MINMTVFEYEKVLYTFRTEQKKICENENLETCFFLLQFKFSG